MRTELPSHNDRNSDACKLMAPPVVFTHGRVAAKRRDQPKTRDVRSADYVRPMKTTRSRRRSLTLAVGLPLALLVSASNADAADVKPGEFVKGSGATIYLVDRRRGLRPIPNSPTLVCLGKLGQRPWKPRTLPDSALAKLPKRRVVPSLVEGTLYRHKNGRYFVIKRCQRRYFSTAADVTALGYRSATAIKVGNRALGNIPKGPKLVAAPAGPRPNPGEFVKSTSGKLYQVDHTGALKPIPNYATLKCLMRASQPRTLAEATIAGLRKAAARYDLSENTLYRNKSGRYFVIKGCQRRYFSTAVSPWAFGYRANLAKRVANGALNHIPKGQDFIFPAKPGEFVKGSSARVYQVDNAGLLPIPNVPTLRCLAKLSNRSWRPRTLPDTTLGQLKKLRTKDDLRDGTLYRHKDGRYFAIKDCQRRYFSTAADVTALGYRPETAIRIFDLNNIPEGPKLAAPTGSPAEPPTTIGVEPGEFVQGTTGTGDPRFPSELNLVYQVDTSRRLTPLPNTPTLKCLAKLSNRSWHPRILPDAVMAKLEKRLYPLPNLANGTLYRNENGRYFLIKACQRRYFSTAAEVKALGYSPGGATKVGNQALDHVPKGPELAAPATTLPAALAAKYKVILDDHNDFRARHCVPPVAWSEEIAKLAQSWADRCVQKHNPNRRTANYFSIGENMMFGGKNPEQVVDGWYNEIQSYDFNDPNPRFSSGTGHFTQVVWKDTRLIGCGFAKCSWGNNWVCNYWKHGNYAGQYPQNVPKPCK